MPLIRPENPESTTAAPPPPIPRESDEPPPNPVEPGRVPEKPEDDDPRRAPPESADEKPPRLADRTPPPTDVEPEPLEPKPLRCDERDGLTTLEPKDEGPRPLVVALGAEPNPLNPRFVPARRGEDVADRDWPGSVRTPLDENPDEDEEEGGALSERGAEPLPPFERVPKPLPIEPSRVPCDVRGAGVAVDERGLENERTVLPPPLRVDENPVAGEERPVVRTDELPNDRTGAGVENERDGTRDALRPPWNERIEDERAPPEIDRDEPPNDREPPEIERDPPPIERAPPPKDRAPPPIERAPPPADRTPPPLTRAPPPPEPRAPLTRCCAMTASLATSAKATASAIAKGDLFLALLMGLT